MRRPRDYSKRSRRSCNRDTPSPALLLRQPGARSGGVTQAIEARELEITDQPLYLEKGQLDVVTLGRGFAARHRHARIAARGRSSSRSSNGVRAGSRPEEIAHVRDTSPRRNWKRLPNRWPRAATASIAAHPRRRVLGHFRNILAERRRQIDLVLLFLPQDLADVFGDRILAQLHTA